MQVGLKQPLKDPACRVDHHVGQAELKAGLLDDRADSGQVLVGQAGE